MDLINTQNTENTDNKKKRGRKANNSIQSETLENILFNDLKKKRGRKKKYEIENSIKILNRFSLNNFNHNIVYSDEEQCINTNNINKNNTIQQYTEPKINTQDPELINQNGINVRQISFGNLNITVSKNEVTKDINYKNILLEKKSKIVINEYSSDDQSDNSESENIEQFENKNLYPSNKTLHVNQSTIFKGNDNNLKNIKIVSTLKNIIKDSTFPEETNIYCWWCCHSFRTSPCTLPISYDSYRKKYKYIGIFCSWNCVKSYNFELKDQKVSERCSIITLLLKEIYNLPYALNIKQAPPRQSLKIFGGYLSIEEFRNNSSSSSNIDTYKLNLLNGNFIYPEIIELSKINRKKKIKK